MQKVEDACNVRIQSIEIDGIGESIGFLMRESMPIEFVVALNAALQRALPMIDDMHEAYWRSNHMATVYDEEWTPIRRKFCPIVTRTKWVVVVKKHFYRF